MDAKVFMAAIFVVILLVGVGIPIISSIVSDSTEPQTSTNEGIVCTNGTTIKLDYDELTSATVILTNGTNLITDGNYSVTAASGSVWFIQYNKTLYGDSCRITYDYYDDIYNSSPISRTIIGYVLTFAALAALAIVSKMLGLW